MVRTKGPMPDPHIRAAFYLSPTLDQWWRWEDSAQVLAWRDGSTIAFAAEVETVMERLAPQGLPPFGAVTLVLAACRDRWLQWKGRKELISWAKSLEDSQRTGIKAGVGSDTKRSGDSRFVEEMQRLLAGLDAIAGLPRHLRDSPAAKALLAEVVFEGSKNRGSIDTARQIVEAMRTGLAPQTLRPQMRPREPDNQFAHVVAGMADGLARIDAASLELRSRTGLDQSVRSPEKDVAPPQKVRQLLAELRSDEELSGLARLACDLMAAVAVPRSLRHRQELPLGGVSDLTNRGSLDRLLISELAQDDLTLAVRVAVNEAMYLRRESPPKEPPHHRLILIDAGIRMWGVPRVFATAVALALAATGDSKAEMKVFRAAGDRLVAADLTTREGLVAHLAALESAAHPGAAVPAFAEVMKDAEAGGMVDAFVLSHADAIADDEFIAALRDARLPSVYVGSVNRDGQFRLVARTRLGVRPIRDAKFSLNETLASRPKRPRTDVPLLDPTKGREEWPAIFFASPFPFRLPHHADPERSAFSNKLGLVTVTVDGRLLHSDSQARGALQLYDAVPRGQLRMVAIDEGRAKAYVLVVRGRESTATLVWADLVDKASAGTIAIDLPEPAPSRAFLRGAFVFVVASSRVDAFALADGRHVAGLNLPARVVSHRGRFFCRQLPNDIEFLAVAFDGSRELKLEKLPVDGPAHAVFDRDGHEGTWSLTPGKVADQSGKTVIPLPSHLAPENLIDVSADGNRLLFGSARNADRGFVFDLQNAAAADQSCPLNDWARHALGCRTLTTGHGIQLLKKFTHIGIDANGSLVLTHHRRRSARRLAFLATDVCCLSVAFDGSLIALRPFEAYRSSAMRVKQSVAQWPDGSRAWLDTRGILHLRSSDRSIPELSIVLRDVGSVSAQGLSAAVWSSDAKLAGWPYFGGDGKTELMAYFQDIMRRFVERLRTAVV